MSETPEQQPAVNVEHADQVSTPEPDPKTNETEPDDDGASSDDEAKPDGVTDSSE